MQDHNDEVKSLWIQWCLHNREEKHILVANTVAADADAINTNKKLIFENFAPITTHKQHERYT